MRSLTAAVVVVLLGLPGPVVADAFVSNDAYITGLYTDLDLEDPIAVFGLVFDRLDPEVRVYPSEGYYYFRFPIRGLTVMGTIALYAPQRDEGVLEFGYTGEIEDRAHGLHRAMPGRNHVFDRDSRLRLNRIDDFTYDAAYRGKTVRFRLEDPGLEAPAAAHLAEFEEYVCTAFDESGLKFDLLFNREAKRMYWVLNERQFVPEAFLEITNEFVKGARTRFIFYLDAAYERKVLAAVHTPEVSRNSWYDGPFDQVPDTYISMGRLNFKKYLVACGVDPRMVDEYGNFVDTPNARIPMSTYGFYTSPEDLDYLYGALESDVPEWEFYATITAEEGRWLLRDYPTSR